MEIRPISADMLDEIVVFLSKLEFFEKIPQLTVLRELVSKMEWISVAGGETVIKQNDVSNCLYVVLYGRLRVIEESESGHERILEEIYPGQIVGEIALLINDPRSASVQAIRDSILLKLTQEVFEQFTNNSPEVMLSIARMCLKRVLHKTSSASLGANISTLVVAPAGRGEAAHSKFAEELVNAMKSEAHTILINSTVCNRLLGREIAQAPLEGSDHASIVAWLQSQEAKYQYVVYVTDPTLTPWTLRCLRQADRIMLVANAEDETRLSLIEEREVYRQGKNSVFTDLILLHKSTPIKETIRWLDRRPFLQTYHHVRVNNPYDLKKIVRIILGKNLGLVLGGGGARGFGYVGVYKALQELNVPIDFIGGTSIGAVIGAGIALGRSWEDSIDLIKYFIARNKLDYTLPLLSITKGKRLSEILKTIMGENIHIEDLLTRFFCVSTNITRCSVYSHEKGLLWKALRTTSALPAVYPPMACENGDLLVDGAVLNNLPVDIMREKISGGQILAVSCNALKHKEAHQNTFIYPFTEEYVSGWTYLRKKYRYKNTNNTTVDFPNIIKIIETSIGVGSDQSEILMGKEADYFLALELKYNILDFDSYQQIIDEGYRSAMEYLPKIIDKLPKGSNNSS